MGEYRQQGCLPSAMLNFLSLLGWNDGTEQEIYSKDELTQIFSLDRIHKSGAVFDKAKLVSCNWLASWRDPRNHDKPSPKYSSELERQKWREDTTALGTTCTFLMGLETLAMQEWMNGQYLKHLPTDEVVPLLAEQWTSSGLLKK